MSKYLKSSSRLAIGAAALVAVSAGAAAAQDAISGSAGVSVNSHFISYGADVWGAGDDLFGDEMTVFAWSDVTVDFGNFFVTSGVWGDINDNAPDSIGGDIQEIDWWLGAGFSAGAVSFGATYQAWHYASDVEQVIDLSVSLDDSEMWGFALNPSVVWHIRVDGNAAAGQADGSAIVASIGPSFDLSDWVSLTIPAGIAFFLDDDFQGGTDGDIGYGYLGASFGVPLTFIGSQYGDWGLNLDFTYYLTDSDAIPGNPESDFLTSSLGVSVAF